MASVSIAQKLKERNATLSEIETALWTIARLVVFKQNETDEGNVNCYTCPQNNLEGGNRHCGHGYHKSALGASMKYDIRILRPQCMICNMMHDGRKLMFWTTMAFEIGKEKADALYLECVGSKGRPIKAREHYLRLLSEYEAVLSDLAPVPQAIPPFPKTSFSPL